MSNSCMSKTPHSSKKKEKKEEKEFFQALIHAKIAALFMIFCEQYNNKK